MHIAFLISGSLDFISGGYIYDRHLVEHLRGDGHTVSLVNIPSTDYAGKLLENFDGSIISKLRELKPDLVLEDELDHPALFRLNRRIHSILVLPIVTIVHHLRSCELRPGWQNGFFRSLERVYLDSVDGFVFISDTTRRAVESLTGNGRPSIVANPCGDRLESDFTPAQVRSRTEIKPLQVLFVGNIIRRKGLHVLLSAMERLPDAEVSLHVVGNLDIDKSYARDIQKMASDGLRERTAFHGAIPDKELVKLLRSSHVLAVPSSYEGYGIVYLEGMSFGLPAIASKTCTEIVRDGHNGFLVPYGDAGAIARRLREIGRDRYTLRYLSLNALNTFNSHPKWQSTCHRVTGFLKTFKNK
jgi:glycosyltransferase involved in cell wall biosynthesis